MTITATFHVRVMGTWADDNVVHYDRGRDYVQHRTSCGMHITTGNFMPADMRAVTCLFCLTGTYAPVWDDADEP